MKNVFLFAISLMLLVACAGDTGVSCEDDFDCSNDLVCRLSSGQCVPFVCETDSDCEADETCDDNVCIPSGL